MTNRAALGTGVILGCLPIILSSASILFTSALLRIRFPLDTIGFPSENRIGSLSAVGRLSFLTICSWWTIFPHYLQLLDYLFSLSAVVGLSFLTICSWWTIFPHYLLLDYLSSLSAVGGLSLSRSNRRLPRITGGVLAHRQGSPQSAPVNNVSRHTSHVTRHDLPDDCCSLVGSCHPPLLPTHYSLVSLVVGLGKASKVTWKD